MDLRRRLGGDRRGDPPPHRPGPGRADAAAGASSTGGPTRWPAGCSAPALTGQDKVAVYLYNCPEYLETYYRRLQGRPASRSTPTTATPTTSWSTCGTTPTPWPWCSTARFVERIEGIRDRVPRVRSWLWVDDGPATVPAWAVPYEAMRRRRRRGRGRRAVGPLRRRHLHALHRRHDRHAQGGDVAPGRPVRPRSAATASAATPAGEARSSGRAVQRCEADGAGMTLHARPARSCTAPGLFTAIEHA